MLELREKTFQQSARLKCLLSQLGFPESPKEPAFICAIFWPGSSTVPLSSSPTAEAV